MQDQRSRLDSKRAEMQSTLEQATAAALEYRQLAEALKAKVDNSRQGWEQATNELKRQIEGVLNEVTGLSSHRARLDKSVEELKSLEGKVLNCDQVTTNMAEEIRRIGLNFGDAEKRVHGVEAMVESHEASISQLINRVHNLEHPAVSSTSTGEVGEATVPAAEVRRIAANLEHLGFYGVQKSQNQLQSEILLFLSNYTIKSIFSGVSPPPPHPPNWKFSSP